MEKLFYFKYVISKFETFHLHFSYSFCCFVVHHERNSVGNKSAGIKWCTVTPLIYNKNRNLTFVSNIIDS